tara:strand:- start:78 stop:800 length:723 start_codon:yes stop_codon:yes gene_type:complete
MPRFTFPAEYDDIVNLYNDANNLAEDNERLKRLLKGKLKNQGRPSSSTSGAPKQPEKQSTIKLSAASSSNGVNGACAWAAAPSVADVAAKSVNLGGAKLKMKKRPVEPEKSDSDDDTPLPKKTKLAPPAKKPKEGKANGKDGKKEDKAPKGSSAYNVYFGERTTALRKESPELDRSEIATKVGAEWKELTDEEKVPWKEEAAKRNAVKFAAYEAAKANGGMSTLAACTVENDEDDDGDDD